MTDENLNSSMNNASVKDSSKTKFLLLFISNGILIVALAVIVIFYFKHKKQCSNSNDISIMTPKSKPSSIVFINIDSVINNYDLTKELHRKLELERNKLENDFNNKKSSFDKEVQTFQKRIETNTIKSEEAQLTEKKLQEKERQLYELNETYTGQFSKLELETNIAIKDSITNFLNRYYKNKYDYIMAYTPGSSVLFADTKNEITIEVLNALNAEYKNKKVPNKK